MIFTCDSLIIYLRTLIICSFIYLLSCSSQFKTTGKIIIIILIKFKLYHKYTYKIFYLAVLTMCVYVLQKHWIAAVLLLY